MRKALRPDRVLLVLDFEKNGHYPGGTMRVDQAVTFVERIRQRTGKYPGVYGSEYRLRAMLNGRRREFVAKTDPCQLLVMDRELSCRTAQHGALGSVAPLAIHG